MRFRALYDAGAESLRHRYQPRVGAMMFDAQLARGEKMVEKATGAVAGVKSALVANAVVTGVSTVVLVASALRARRGARRG